MPKNFKITQSSGFYLDKDKATLPEVPGIYVVYKCDYDSFHDRVDVKEPLYIGESQNIRERHNGTSDHPSQHDHYEAFVRAAGGAGHICYGIVPMEEFSAEERKMIQDAMIFTENPPINEGTVKEYYSHPSIHLALYGFPASWNHPTIKIIES